MQSAGIVSHTKIQSRQAAARYKKKRAEISPADYTETTMSYMAVGSRQILFADASVPAAPRDDVREVANLGDNTQVEATRPAAAPEPERVPVDSSAGVSGANGSRVDVQA